MKKHHKACLRGVNRTPNWNVSPLSKVISGITLFFPAEDGVNGDPVLWRNLKIPSSNKGPAALVCKVQDRGLSLLFTNKQPW